MTLHICPFCEIGNLIEVRYTEQVKIGRKVIGVDGLSKMVCSECESESIPAELFDANSNLVKAALAKTPASPHHWTIGDQL